MATRSSIGYETDDGGCIGVYCQWDGYPKHMLPILKEMTFEQVKEMIEDALMDGGLRCVNENLTYETYQEQSAYDDWRYNTAFANLNGTDYAYYKRKDGSVFATDSSGKEIVNY